MPTVHAIFTCLRHRLPMKHAAEAVAIADRGLQGCAHGGPGSKRQVLLMDVETLELLGLRPGQIKENITTRGVNVQGLRGGQRLRIGGARLEVTVHCGPCKRMDDIRPGLERELRGRRGMLCRVVEGGTIRVGDSIEFVELMQVAG